MTYLCIQIRVYGLYGLTVIKYNSTTRGRLSVNNIKVILRLFLLLEMATATEDYSMTCDLWRGIIDKKTVCLQSLLKDVQLFEDLHRFGDISVFDRTFIKELEWLHEVWLMESECSIDVYEDTMERRDEIERKLKYLPFEKAMCYKEPEFHTKSNLDIVKNVFGDDVEWRFTPSIVKHMSIEDRERVFTHFEYMLYFVINVREELAFDIQSYLCRYDKAT